MKRFFLVNVIMAAFSLCSMLYAQTVEKGATQEMSVGSSNLEANLMQAIDAALGEAQKALLTALPENKTVAVLPLPSQKQGTFNSGSNDFFVEKMTNILTQHGYKVAVSKEDEVFNELVKQIVWDAKRSFFCEKAEVVKRLGQMKNAQVLLYGSINKVSMFGNHINVELPLYAIDVDKATHLWGDTFKGSAFLGKDIDGIVEMPTEFMNLFTKVFDDAGKELKQAFKDKMLMDKVNAHTVAMLPMNGDIDQYVTGKAREMFTKVYDLKTIESNIPTLEQALVKFGAPDKKLADSIFWGSIRDISTTYLPDRTDEKNWTKITGIQCRRVEVELNLSEASTGATIWSRTFSKESTTGNPPVAMTYGEIKSYLNAKYGSLWWFYTSAGKTLRVVVVSFIGLCVLIVIIRGVLIATRPR